MAIPSLDDLLREDLRGTRVLVRSDLNVPLKDGEIADDSRIRASLPTLKRLCGAGARVIVCSHLGRPKGQKNQAMSLRPVAEALRGALSGAVHFADDCIGPGAKEAVAATGPGELLLLENLRFHAGETSNEAAFCEALAAVAEVYINDAFGTAHRAHASTVGVAERIPRVAAGDLLRTELEQLKRVLEPDRPFLCLLGGAKVSDKLGVLEVMIERAESVAVGGAMAYTFLRAQGQPTGTSLVEEERLDDARRIEKKAQECGHELLLPSDHVVVCEIGPDSERRVVNQIEDPWLGVDIGPESAKRYADAAGRAATIFWNGPMGIFEIDAFASGTETVARAVAASSAHSVVGGGDSLAAVNKTGVGDAIDHLSTGGGASLEFIEGRVLPGVAVLERVS